MIIEEANDVLKLLGGVLALGTAGLLFWKKGSNTNLQVKKDTSEGDWLKKIEIQSAEHLKRADLYLDRAEAAEKREQECAAKISSLELKVKFQTERLERQGKQLRVLKDYILENIPSEKGYQFLLTSAFMDLPPELEQE